MPVPREHLAAEPTVTQSVASNSSHEETATRALSVTSPDEAALPRFATPAIAGELGRLGKYRIQKELGRGGMGAVYLAFDERLQRKVALKVMLPKAAANDTAKERFLREARAAAQISSDHVVNIFEADEIDGIPYIALQYLQGYPLDEFLKKKGNPTIPQTIRIGAETALGLAKAHKLGLVHRDIKPGNLWLEAPTGRVKILDFGLVKPVVGAEGAELTGSGAIMGTPAYMSPEQGLGKPVDGRADLFSLGCVLYRLCTGKLPFERPTLMAILTAIATEEPPPVREVNPAVPEPLADLIRRLMAKNPADRPASAQSVAKELDQISATAKAGLLPEVSVSQPQVIYVPIAVSIQESNPFADIDEPTEFDSLQPKSETLSKPPRKFPAKFVGSLFLGLMAIVAAGVIIIKITNKDGTTTTIEVPDGSKIEVNGKTINTGPKKGNPTATPDRKAAEYVLSIGGTVRVNGQEQDIKAAAELPKEAFQLTHLNLHKKKVGDAGMAHLKECKSLTYLDLTNTQVSDAGLAYLKDCKSLTHLNLWATQVSDAGLAHFKDCKNLTYLNLSGTQVSDAGLANFKDSKNLAELDLGGTQLSDAGLAHFKDCKNLTFLSLHKTKVGDAGVAHFKDCKNLTFLDLTGTQVSDAGMAHFKDCKNLAELKLGGTQVSDAGLANFKECKNLTALNLNDTQVGGTGLADFKDCKNLTVLYLQTTKVTAAKFEELKKAFPQCTIESDYGRYEPPVNVDRKAAEYVLSIGGTIRVNGQDREIKAAADLPREAFELTFVDLKQNPKVSDAGLAIFKDCKNLTYLNLHSAPMTDAGLAHFKDCKNLTELHLGVTPVSDVGLALFKNCKNLTVLDLALTQVSDAGLALFKDCKNLTSISLHYTQVGDAGLAHLKDYKSLTSLTLTGTKVTDAGLALFKDFKTLTYINLNSTQVSDVGMAHLTNCKNLTHLNLQKTKVTAAKFEELKKALPKCTIESDYGTYESPDVDRKAAEYVLSIGGAVRVNGLDPEIKAVADLPREAKLTQFNLQGNAQVSDAGLAHFNERKNLTHLDLSNTQVSNAGLVHFKDCKNLTALCLDGCVKVSDAGLANFKDSKNLTYLNLTLTQVSDAGLANFQGRKNLTQLILNGTQVSDAGLANFQDCKNLTLLLLNGTQVSDAGLAHFKDCKNLTHLNLQKTKVTAAKFEELKKAFPKCKIESDHGTYEPK